LRIVDDHGSQALGGAVDRRREAGGPRAHDDDVEGDLLDVVCRACGLRDLRVGGIAEDAPVGEDHRRERHLAISRRQELAALLGVGEGEGVRDGAALEDLPQLVRPPGPLLTDDVDGVWDQVPLGRPLEQKARDRLVEDLVDRGGRPGNVVVDPPHRHRVEDRLGMRRVRPCPAGHDQAPLGVRMELARSLEQLISARIGERLAGQHERHVLTIAGQLLQPAERPLGIAQALDPVVVRITLDELGLDAVEDIPIRVDRE
jgi:hypothetical protein